MPQPQQERTVLAQRQERHATLDGRAAQWMRAAVATNALEHGADIAKIQKWFGHAKD